jgi:uncharacterized repeat protein (TIGR03803 family)
VPLFPRALVHAARLALLILVAVQTGLHAQTPARTFRPAANVCVLCDFGGTAGNPLWPKEPGRLVRSGDFLYTTTPSGGSGNNSGTLIRVAMKTGALEILHSFGLDARGANPLGGLVDAGDGSFRGTTYTGGTYPIAPDRMRVGTGTVFSYAPGQKQPQILHTFRNGDLSGLVPELCPPKRPCQHSPQQRLNAAAGYPVSAPVKGSDGAWYGVTSYSWNQAYGVLYKVTPYKSESGITTLCMNGAVPTEPDLTDAQLRARCLFTITNGNKPVSLTAGPSGDLYGVTAGGANGNLHGTLFAATLDGRVTELHRFDAARGATPLAVLLASDGLLYGTTLTGGVLRNGRPGSGVIWRMGRGRGYEVLYTFTGGADGAQPISGLVEKTDADGVRQFYGVARYGGEGRGVLYRISERGVFKALHQHPGSWGATGRTPSTTLLEVDGAFYGTTYQGGANDGGVLFRMSEVDLPEVAQPLAPPFFTTGTLAASATVPWPGQAQPILIEVFTGVAAWQPNPDAGIDRLQPKPIPGLTDDGIKIRVANCRNPHILQFIYREKLAADGTPSGAMFSTSGGESYQFTTDPKNPVWHTDAGAGRPNPYYDQAGGRAPKFAGTARIVNPFGLTTFDQPNFNDPLLFPAGARETWRATFKNYVICNCRVVREIHWAREVPWIVDLSGTPLVVPDITKGKQGPPRYLPVRIIESTDAALIEANKQISADGYTPITVLLGR